MINVVIRKTLGPSSARNKLLTTVLDLYDIPYCIVTPDNINGPVITDSFVEQVPSDDSEYCKQIIDRCVSLGAPILFYYPSECESTLSSSYYPTRDYVANRIPISLVKQGNRSVDGFTEYNLDKYFIYRATTEFNRARLAYTFEGINTQSKSYKFLFLNGTLRPNREETFRDLEDRDLLKHSLHSFIDYRIPNGQRPKSVKPDIDWPDANFHEDFRFENFYPPHFWSTEFTLALETAPNESFITEKTYKPLLVGHPVVVVAGQGSLQFLRSLGFKTFSGIINESYDLSEWPGERRRAVVDEVQRLCNNSVDIISQTYDIRLHNRLNMYKLTEEVYYDLYKIITSVFPTYQTPTYVDLPNLTLSQYQQYS